MKTFMSKSAIAEVPGKHKSTADPATSDIFRLRSIPLPTVRDYPHAPLAAMQRCGRRRVTSASASRYRAPVRDADAMEPQSAFLPKSKSSCRIIDKYRYMRAFETP
ncbi:hypothetical protein [Chitinasiproducens palmae]|uniref:hypothetical protein n=1 Tax=Chitinasiproducens palmae TaxID=1770053 RepID=UPI001B8B9C6C|nr:hypothetical protein [Chitinasiproducens palmae]